MNSRKQSRNATWVILATIIAFACFKTCEAQTYDLKEVSGHGYKGRKSVDGFINLSDSTASIIISQGARTFYNVKLVFKWKESTVYELSVLGQKAFIEVKETSDLDGVHATITHMKRYETNSNHSTRAAQLMLGSKEDQQGQIHFRCKDRI